MSLSKSVKSEFVVYKPDGVWQYFLREKNGQSAKCKRCENEIKTAGGTTTGLHVHLRTKHDIDFKKTTIRGFISKCSKWEWSQWIVVCQEE